MSDSGSDIESKGSESPAPRSPVAEDRRSRSNSPVSNKSRSRSGSRSRSVSRSRSPSGSKSRTPSKSPSRSRSRSRSKSRSPSRDRSHSRSRSGSGDRAKKSKSRSHSRSRTRSKTPARSRSHTPRKSRSRSSSANLEIDEQRSVAGERPDRDDSEGKEPEKKKTSKLIDTDSEEDEVVADKVSAAAIFGDDADDISDDSDNDEKDKPESDKEVRRSRSKSRSRSRSKSKSRSRSRERSGNEEEKQPGEEEEYKETEPEVLAETRIDVEVPKITCDLGRDLNFVKLPNFLSVETRPFDPETYEDEIDEEETLDEEGRARLKLKVENTIRWREVMDKEGNTQKESNARVVRWSDGSYSLHLGSEIFDVYRQPLQGDHNHMFIRQGTGLQGQAVFRNKLSFRPHSTESFTHRKMTLSLADRSQKTSGIKILSQVGIDPDNDRAERLKKEEEKLRQTVRSKTARRKSDISSRGHSSILSLSKEEEGSDDEGAISISAIKNKFKGGVNASRASIYSSDEEDSDFDTRKGRKSERTRAALKDSEDESGSD